MKNHWNQDHAPSSAETLRAFGAFIAQLLLNEPSVAPRGGWCLCTQEKGMDPFGNPCDLTWASSDQSLGLDTEDFVPLDSNKLRSVKDWKLTGNWQTPFLATVMNPKSPPPGDAALFLGQIPAPFSIWVNASAILALTQGRDDASRIQDTLSIPSIPFQESALELARTLSSKIQEFDQSGDSLVIESWGLVVFGPSPKNVYDRLVALITQAENALRPLSHEKPKDFSRDDVETLAQLRSRLCQQEAQVAHIDESAEAISLSTRQDLEGIAPRLIGIPHLNNLHRACAVLDQEVAQTIDKFEQSYGALPQTVIWPRRGIVCFGSSAKEAKQRSDVAHHAAIAWCQLEEDENLSFDVPPETKRPDPHQESASSISHRGSHVGKVAIVTGAAAGIGHACARVLGEEGATVVGIDLDPSIIEAMESIGGRGVIADLTQEDRVVEAIEGTVRSHGGLDIVVSNAGIFTAGAYLEKLESDNWDRSFAVNVTSHQRFLKHAIGFLKQGVTPSVILVGSRNVHAPGAGAASYSCAKAALTQLGRVAALELAQDGVRVNIIHPDAVFDTKLWTPEVLKRSADRYGLTVEEYKARNLMKTEILSVNVANMVSAMAGEPFAKTTGAQIPIDGGNDRII